MSDIEPPVDSPAGQSTDPPAAPPLEQAMAAPPPAPMPQGLALPPLSPQDERTYAMAAHVSGFIAPLLGPLVVQVLNKQRSAFVDDHVKEALNFHINILIAIGISFVLSLVLIGICGFVAVGIAFPIFMIIAGIAAYNGQPYRYPMIFRFIK